MDEETARERLSYFGKSFFDRGLAFGSAGNMSLRLADGFLITPTNCCLGDLDPVRIAKLDCDGLRIGGDAPTKEKSLHMAVYTANPNVSSVIHLHSTYLTALSCLDHPAPHDILPPLTPYFVMKIGRVALVPYFRPGAPELAEATGALAAEYSALVLANHGPVVCGSSIEKTAYAIEELEETAKLFFLLKDSNPRFLSSEQVRELKTG